MKTGGPVTLVADVGEEGLGDLRGVKALFGETMKGGIDRFVSIDGAGLDIVFRAVGSHRYHVTFHGPGGHSFGAFGLANPAGALGRAIAKLQELRVPRDPRTTFNVGRVGGGTSVNAIPSEAWMEIDLRSSDAATLAELDARAQAAIDEAVKEENARWGRAQSISVERQLVGDRPAGETPPDAPIVQTAVAVSEALGLDVRFGEGSTDANLPMSLGIPAITIGGGGRATGGHAPGGSVRTRRFVDGHRAGNPAHTGAVAVADSDVRLLDLLERLEVRRPLSLRAASGVEHAAERGEVRAAEHDELRGSGGGRGAGGEVHHDGRDHDGGEERVAAEGDRAGAAERHHAMLPARCVAFMEHLEVAPDALGAGVQREDRLEHPGQDDERHEHRPGRPVGAPERGRDPAPGREADHEHPHARRAPLPDGVAEVPVLFEVAARHRYAPKQNR